MGTDSPNSQRFVFVRPRNARDPGCSSPAPSLPRQHVLKGPSAMNLAGYERPKFELSDLLQTIITYKLAEANRAHQNRLQNLLARLAEYRFNLVVAGRLMLKQSAGTPSVPDQGRTNRIPTCIGASRRTAERQIHGRMELQPIFPQRHANLRVAEGNRP